MPRARAAARPVQRGHALRVRLLPLGLGARPAAVRRRAVERGAIRGGEGTQLAQRVAEERHASEDADDGADGVPRRARRASDELQPRVQRELRAARPRL